MELPRTEGEVLPEWIDENSHMNLAYYVVLFDRQTAALYNFLGVGQLYRNANAKSPFAAETHTIYERELQLGERVHVTSHMLGASAKCLHYFHEMFHAEDGQRVAAQELIALHIDLKARRTTPFAPEVLERLREAVTECERRPEPKGVGRRIAMLKKD